MVDTPVRNRRAGIALLPALTGLALAAIPAPAHHSAAMFDWSREVEMKGAIVERWDWINPHTVLHVRTRGGNGQPEHWTFEGMSPDHLGRNGWSRRTLKPGDKIDLSYYSMKDGSKSGFNIMVKLADGSVMRQLESPAARQDR